MVVKQQSFIQRLDLLARNITPFLLGLVLIMVSQLPTHLPELGRISPMLALIAVYHWGVFRPELLPSPAVFVLGLFLDLLSGGPVGINAMILLLVYGLVLSQRRFLFGKSFAVVWIGFGVIGAAATLVTFIVVSLYHLTPVSPQGFLFQFFLTLGLFPLVSWLLLRWQRLVLRG